MAGSEASLPRPLPMQRVGWSERVASWESLGCLQLASPPCRSPAVGRALPMGTAPRGGTDLGVTLPQLWAAWVLGIEPKGTVSVW